jgi:hypothetical protein
MDFTQDDRFVVFLRHDRSSSARPDAAEKPLRTCSTYQEARQIQRRFLQEEKECIIRYVGLAGGGD